MRGDQSDLGTALTNSIRDDQVVDAAATVADIGIDAAINSGALDGVPVIGALTSIYRAGRQISQFFFQKKIHRFLNEMSRLSLQERESFTEKLHASGESSRFGETILLLLERADELDKPVLIARIFVAHISGNFDYSTAVRLSHIVNRSIYSDLTALGNFNAGLQDDQEIADALYSAGLLAISGFDGGSRFDGGGGLMFELNRFGKALAPLI